MNDSLPLIHEGDAFLLELQVGLRAVRITNIFRTPNNANVNAVLERYHDLDPDTQKAILAQIKRRYSKHQINA